jgi:dienelactone hydrolase
MQAGTKGEHMVFQQVPGEREPSGHPAIRRVARAVTAGCSLMIAGWLLPAVAWSSEKFQNVAMKLHSIADDSAYSACAVLDVNRDGQPDIYCGGFWYEGPHWTPHPTRVVPNLGGRLDDYANLPLDVDGDGWQDIVSVNYRSQSLFWIRNPTDNRSPWITHLIDSPGPSETGRLVDMDRDGELDVLPNGTTFAGWYRRERVPSRTGGLAAVSWARHELPERLAGHGLGWGDVDDDGRVDLIGRHGWYAAPANPLTDRWVPHEEFRLHADPGIPILVEDVDGDGDRDLIWSRGHHTGLYWLEQERANETTVGAKRLWRMHTIDTQVSQSHTLAWADLDGNGRWELIAAKRWMGHDGRDPGEWDPQYVARYEWDAGSRTWRRQWLSWQGRCGADLQMAIADLDQDGDLDLVLPTRKGLHWLENRGHLAPQLAESQEEERGRQAGASRYQGAETLLTLRNSAGEERPLRAPHDLGLRREQVLQRMQQVMGPLPGPEHRVSLEVRRDAVTQRDGYQEVRLTYQSEVGDRVPAVLLVPDGLAGPAPAVLALHQTQDLGKGEVCGWGGKASMHYGRELAQRGFVVLAPDYPSFGEYAYDFPARVGQSACQSGSMKAIWNNLRAVDLLESLPEVDQDAIGCIGHSLGGHNGLFTAAFDTRIRAVVTSCGFTGFPDYYGGNLKGWTSDRYMPRIASDHGNDPRRVPFDFDEVLAAICPRAVFVNAPLHDDNFDVAGVRKVMRRVEALYSWASVSERLSADYPDAAHDFPQPIRERAYAWLRTQLQQR